MSALRNEQDVREEIATPFLKLLGYQSGTASDILREYRLRYAAMQLGRKKVGDIPIPQGGDADYLLVVSGVGRWILETKPPDQDISVDDIDQAISYARHPEVSGAYAAILNGRRFVLYHSTQTSNEPPLVDLEVTTVEGLASSLAGSLTPDAIRRDCSSPKIDLRSPLAPGLRGEAAIISGWNRHLAIDLETTLPLPQVALDTLKQQYGKIVGMQSAVEGGKIWRDDASRIRAKISWSPPHMAMKPMLDAARLNDFEYVCLGNEISTDHSKPSVFDILASYQLSSGQPIYDILHWKTNVMGSDASFSIQGQAVGYLDGAEFRGCADFRSTAFIAGLGGSLTTHFSTEFSFVVDKS